MPSDNAKKKKDPVITSLEALKLIEETESKLLDARLIYESAILREKDIEGLTVKVEKLKTKLKEKEKKIKLLEEKPDVKKFQLLKKWEVALHDHLNGNQHLYDEDLELLYLDIQNI